MNIISINLSKTQVTVKIVMDLVPDTVSLKELSTKKKLVFKRQVETRFSITFYCQNFGILNIIDDFSQWKLLQKFETTSEFK